MSNTVVVGAQMGLATVLKPPANFESVYQGRNALENPIALPGTLDFQAGKPGFEPNLLAGIPAPLSSRLLLWFPAAYTSEGFSMPVYHWRILWRLRSSLDQADSVNSEDQKGTVGHIAAPLPGIPDGGQLRLILPCAMSSILFEQTEPAGTADVVNNLRGEQIAVQGNSYDTSFAPLLMSGARGIASQGIYESLSADNGRAGGPTYMPYVTDVMGDEFFLLVCRAGASPWDFSGPDRLFSRIFGTDNGNRQSLPGLGVFTMPGSGAT